MKLLSKRNIIIAVVVLVVIVASVFFLGGDPEALEGVHTVTRQNLDQVVEVIGTVTPASEANLSFEQNGRVAKINVKVGDRVVTGQPLVSLDTTTLAADLAAARAQVAIRSAETRNAEVNLERVKEEQEALVASAYRQLLSDGLVAVAESSGNTLTPPEITGLYRGEPGTYKARITETRTGSAELELRTFQLERTGPIELLENEPTPLGTEGLYLYLPGTREEYIETAWYITIPNTKSSSYLANRNAYEQALSTRDRVVAAAEAEITSHANGTAIAEAELVRAQSEVARIQAEIETRILRAPFAGQVSHQEVKLGEMVGPGNPVVSIISEGQFEIEAQVTEADIGKLKVGDRGTVTLDAYRDSVVFPVTVIRIDPAETVVNGLATYRIIAQFDNQDDRIRSGMTANLEIASGRAENVLTVPIGALKYNRDGTSYVIMAGEEEEKRPVTTGLVGAGGLVEISSGLNEGETVVTSVKKEV